MAGAVAALAGDDETRFDDDMRATPAARATHADQPCTVLDRSHKIVVALDAQTVAVTTHSQGPFGA